MIIRLCSVSSPLSVTSLWGECLLSRAMSSSSASDLATLNAHQNSPDHGRVFDKYFHSWKSMVFFLKLGLGVLSPPMLHANPPEETTDPAPSTYHTFQDRADVVLLRSQLLHWYDKGKRELPWRTVVKWINSCSGFGMLMCLLCAFWVAKDNCSRIKIALCTKYNKYAGVVLAILMQRPTK